MTIRPLLPSDSLEQLTDLIHAAYRPHLVDGLRFVGTHQTVDVTAERFAAGFGLVATLRDEFVGTVVVRPPQPQSAALLYRDPHTWSFGQLAVAPEHTGRGLGKALNAAAIQLALGQGARVMALDTAAPAKRLIALYESWGYRIVGPVDWRPHTNYESVLMARSITARLYVVSGCSGSGKSTLIAALAERGETVSYEPGRQIVREQMAAGSDGLPWKNPQRFLDLCAAQAISEFDRHVHQQGRVFFDRSFIDVAAAVKRTGLIAPEILETAIESRRYASPVFMSPPWEALFHSDAERRHDFTEAVAEYETLLPAYRRHGYEVVFIPQQSVAERVSFILSILSNRCKSSVL